MRIGYTGGIVRRGGWQPGTPDGWARWHWAAEHTESFLIAGGAGCRLYPRHDVAVLIRGFVLDTRCEQPADLARLADRIVSVYREQSALHIDGLEGNFTVALLDGPAARLMVHRNLIGDSHTYYHEVPDGVLFAANLVDLIETSGEAPRPNHDDLPAFFLNRMVPGRNTLFAGFHRLLPGEQLQQGGGRVSVVLRRTLADLHEGQEIGRDAVDRVEETVRLICADYTCESPEAANLLSGGVDSSFLQLHWNRVRSAGASPPQSFCVAVNHPRTQGDREYAESAAVTLGTRHTIVAADEPYASYLLDTLKTTGETPSHVQLAYFLALGREMANQGTEGAIFGEGADSLFGTTLATALQSAGLLRRLFPARLLRRGGAAVAGWLGWKQMRGYFHLADYLTDYERLEHPVNRIAVFADWPAVEGCFGRQAIAGVARSRRVLLDNYRVPASPLERTHYAGVLGSSINIAALVTTLFAEAGVRTFTPFYDSRMLRLVANLAPRQRFPFRRPKSLLKKSLARHGLGELAYRSKKSFGQPIFEWLSPGGQLRPLVEQIDSYPFIDAAALESIREQPTWFLYNLLCYDLWHKTFIHH
jgi:asparagine synthetase B (glutamine-hydrolysing)